KVVLDDQCVGCKLCTIACPYGTMFYNRETQKAFKCNLCGGDPACATACPTQAILYEEHPSADWLGDFASERGARLLAAVGGNGGRWFPRDTSSSAGAPPRPTPAPPSPTPHD